MSKKSTVAFKVFRSAFLLILLAVVTLPAHATDIELDPDGLTVPPEPPPPKECSSAKSGEPEGDEAIVVHPSALRIYGGWLTALQATLRGLEIFRLYNDSDR